MLILANKVDLEDRQVSKKEVSDWCFSQNVQFYETSAKEGKLDFLFRLLVYEPRVAFPCSL
jgi:hypothetical protein